MRDGLGSGSGPYRDQFDHGIGRIRVDRDSRLNRIGHQPYSRPPPGPGRRAGSRSVLRDDQLDRARRDLLRAGARRKKSSS